MSGLAATDAAPTSGASVLAAPGVLARARTILGMFVNPGAALSGALAEGSPVFALAVSGTAFGLFFLQTGIDQARAGQAAIPPLGLGAPLGVLALAGIGALYGTVGLAVVALAAWCLVRLLTGVLKLGSTPGPGTTVRAFALGYAPALVYGVVGIVLSLLLGWNTAIAFGITGVLWAIGPAIATLRRMLGGHIWPAILIATLVGGAMLAGWSLLGT
jgi:hypothetical protein